jgi:ABC-2 type transport system permease protein
MSGERARGRLSTLQAAWVVARRDFMAILGSRAFIFFLLGPLFPVIVGAMAGGVGERMQRTVQADRAIGVALPAGDVDRLREAAAFLESRADLRLPELRPVGTEEGLGGEALLERSEEGVTAVLTGPLDAPRLTGPESFIERWRGPLSIVIARAQGDVADTIPRVALAPVAAPKVADRSSRLLTAQGAQTLLFLLTMLLAGMVLSNLVEEKGNKIIEILAAAIPMDALFLGKLFAMLAVSFVGIAVWGAVGAAAFAAAGAAAPLSLAPPAVGWPLMILLGIVYFAMAYMLLGSVFLAVGSLATTVREVQTISMPVTMSQLVVFFLASFAMTQPGGGIEIAALAIPFSSPYAMVARAAQDPALLPHLLAIAYQALWVAVLVRGGAALFRKRVMKSGPSRRDSGRKRGWFRRART